MSIRTRPATREYRDGWDAAFGKREEPAEPEATLGGCALVVPPGHCPLCLHKAHSTCGDDRCFCMLPPHVDPEGWTECSPACHEARPLGDGPCVDGCPAREHRRRAILRRSKIAGL